LDHHKEEQLMRINLGTKETFQYVKINVALFEYHTPALTFFLKEIKDVFAWTYKNQKGIPLEIIQHCIELGISMLLVHRTQYQLNLNLCYYCQTRF
jgi:hypothetical protein